MCTDDSCSGNSGCVYTSVANGAVCDDGDEGRTEFKSGAVILATGSHPYDATKLTGLGIQYDNVVTSCEFEKMAFEQMIQRKDGKPAREIAFIQ